MFSYFSILSNWAAHLRYHTFLGILREYLKNSKCFKLQEIKFWGDDMIRQKFSMFSGTAVFPPAIEALDVSVRAKSSNPCCCLLSLSLFFFFKFQIVCKIFLRNILGLHGMFRVCLQQRQVNFEILTWRAALFDCAMPCVRSSPEKSIVNSAAQVKRQFQTEIPGQNPKLQMSHLFLGLNPGPMEVRD